MIHQGARSSSTSRFTAAAVGFLIKNSEFCPRSIMGNSRGNARWPSYSILEGFDRETKNRKRRHEAINQNIKAAISAATNSAGL